MGAKEVRVSAVSLSAHSLVISLYSSDSWTAVPHHVALLWLLHEVQILALAAASRDSGQTRTRFTHLPHDP